MSYWSLLGWAGDDWKKRWESVKNKIKWKMELPEPVTHDVGGA